MMLILQQYTLLMQNSLYPIYILLYLINSLPIKKVYIIILAGEEDELIGK